MLHLENQIEAPHTSSAADMLEETWNAITFLRKN